MGMTTATLHFYGADRTALLPLLPTDVLLRENNAPWIDVLCDERAEKLPKLVKQLTSAAACAALLFSYFDDELFQCVLYREGRKIAFCGSEGSWAKLGKELSALFGDEQPAKAFRYAPRCANLEEKLSLLEETVGTALLDCAEAEPRTVARSDGTMRTVKAREAALRKRPNQCVLTALAPDEWPPDWRLRLDLYERIRFSMPHEATVLLHDLSAQRWSVPGAPRLAAITCQSRDGEHLFLFDADTGSLEEQRIPHYAVGRILWRTGSGEIVALFLDILSETNGPSGWGRLAGRGFLACLRPDGSFRWKLAPEFPDGELRRLDYAHTSANGTITVYILGNGRDTSVYQIDGETGALLRQRRIPAAENPRTLVPVEALNGFAYIAENRQQIVLLDETLTETACWDCDKSLLYFYRENIVGTTLWKQSPFDEKLRLYDLRNGACKEIKPEIPTLVRFVLPDGRFLGENEKGNQVTVFDPSGRVVSRHKAQKSGRFIAAHGEGDRPCLLEIRSPDAYGLLGGESDAAETYHVWRLDDVK